MMIDDKCELWRSQFCWQVTFLVEFNGLPNALRVRMHISWYFQVLAPSQTKYGSRM